jgi:cytochrome c556
MRRHMKAWITSSVLLAAVCGSAVIAQAAPDLKLKMIMKQFGAAGDDVKQYGAIFAQAKPFAKPEFPKWDALLDKGKAAADKGDLDGAKAVCKECHTTYRDDYKKKYGSKAP